MIAVGDFDFKETRTPMKKPESNATAYDSGNVCRGFRLSVFCFEWHCFVWHRRLRAACAFSFKAGPVNLLVEAACFPGRRRQITESVFQDRHRQELPNSLRNHNLALRFESSVPAWTRSCHRKNLDRCRMANRTWRRGRKRSHRDCNKRCTGWRIHREGDVDGRGDRCGSHR
jgi:hypothetical protein